MKHRRISKQSGHPAARRLYRMAFVSAAFLAVTPTAGLLLNQADRPLALNGSSSASVVDMALSNGSEVTRGKPGAPPSAAALEAPASKQAPASPAQAAPTTPATPAPPAAPAKKVLDYEFQLQPNYYYCGPAATRIALTARGHAPNQDEVARKLGTTTNGTNSAEDTTRVLNSIIGTNFYQTRSIPGSSASPAQMDQLQADVVHTISNGYAVVANIAGGATDTAGVWHEFPGGHYITIVGYSDDGRTVQVADPSGMFGPATYWMTTINMANWMATRGYSF